MNYYNSKFGLVAGSNYQEVYKNVTKHYSALLKKTKRQPYIRSAYFIKQKIFFNVFWQHLFDKPYAVRAIRMKFFPATLELLQKSRNHPVTVENQNHKSELLHRFYGMTKDKQRFVVQIKQMKRSGKLYLVSIYPE